MTSSNTILYIFTFFSALIISLILTPAARAAAIVLNIIDHPSSDVKTHKEPVPYLGGVAIFMAFSLSLLWIRVLTSFPTGTLHSLRGILIGGLFIFLVGLIDDIRVKGLHYSTKFIFQIAATGMLILFGIHMKFIQPIWFAYVLTWLWVVGITNALNLNDIMDGLASSIATVAGLAFLFISLPTEDIYVNFAAVALAGSALGFLPYNLSKKMKIFMGDSGSLFLGFIIGSLAMGTSYSETTGLGIFVPLIILAVPLYDTLLVFILRISRGLSPFKGSKDHFPLRLEKLGWSRPQILLFVVLLSTAYSLGAFIITKSSTQVAVMVYVGWFLSLAGFTKYVLKVKVK